MIGRALGAVALVASVTAALPLGAQGTPPTTRGGGSTTEPPPATLLYQNFPNPFVLATHAETCVWFDLARSSDVRLDILDIRGRPVRTLFTFEGLSAGRYGRGTGNGCEAPFTWDGTDAAGSSVPGGLYLLRLVADSEQITRKIIVRER